MTDELAKIAEASARGSFFLISGTALATVIMAIATILIGRILGPELYGQYFLAFVIPQLLFLLTDLGVNQGVTRFTASLLANREFDRIARIIRYALMLRVLIGIILFLMNYALADWFASAILQRAELGFFVRIASFSVLFQVVFTTATSAFVGLDKSEYNAITTNVQALAKTIVSIVLVLSGFGVLGAVLGYATSYLAGSAAGAILLFLVLHRKRDGKEDPHVREDLKSLLRYGIPLYVSILLTGIMPLFKSIVLANFTNDADIGNYREAINFATLMTILSVPITTALLAAFSKLDSSTSQKIKSFFKLANKYTALIVIPATVLIIVFSRDIVQIVLGSEFATAAEYLATYCPVYFLVGLGYLTLTSLFNGLGQTKTTLKMSLITFIALVILAPILAGIHAVFGVIGAFIVANAAGTIYGLYAARKRFSIELDTHSLLRIYMVSAVSVLPLIVVVRFIPLPQIIKLGAGIILYCFTYATLVPLTRTVSVSELETVMQVSQRTRLLLFIVKPIAKYQQKILGMIGEGSENE